MIICMKRRFAMLAGVLLAVMMAAGMARAQQPTFRVQGEGTALTKLNLALAPGNGVERPYLLDSARAIQRALVSSGYFTVSVLPPGQTAARPGTDGWTGGEVAFPVRLAAERTGETAVLVTVEVADGSFSRPNHVRRFEAQGGTSRDIGLAAADVLYQYFLKRRGYFSSRLLYVREALDRNRRAFQIVSSDLFGESLRVHVSSRAELSSPEVSPDGSRVVYVAFRQDRPQLFEKPFGGQERPIFRDREIRFSPTFDRAGNLYYTKSVRGNSDIYRYAPGSGREQRLTTDPAIETEPSVSPDGSMLAYVSDASGRQRVLVKSVTGGPARLLGGGNARYGAPSWSPDGKQLAVTRQAEGAFSITLIDLETGEEKPLSTSYFEEHPIWAINGKVVVFERAARGGGAETGLWQVDADTSHVYRLPIDGAPRDPSWVRR